MEVKTINGYDIKDETARNNVEKLKSNYLIDEITYEKFYNSNSKSYVHVIHVPHTDNQGNEIKLQHGFANDNIDTGIETASNFSNRNKTTLTINASVGAVESQVTEQIQYGELLGLYIHNGEVLKDNRNLLNESFLKNRYILGITQTGLLKSYIGDTLSQQILNDGVIETVQAFIPILLNGQNNRQNLINEGCTYWGATTFTETEDETPDYDKIYYVLNNNEYVGVMNLTSFEGGISYYEEHGGEWGRYPRQVICQDSNTLDYYIITGDGKGNVLNKGLTLNDYTTIAKKYNCDFAFVLDGGGSTTTIYKNVMMNNRMDNQTDYSNLNDGTGYVEREVPDFLYFSKDVETENDETINYLLNQINVLNNKINDLILKTDDKFMSTTDFYEKVNQQHLFTFNKWNNTEKDFIKSMEVYFDNSGAYPGGLNIYDVINNIQVLRLHNNLNDGIKFLGKKLAYMPDTILEETTAINIDSLPRNFYATMLKTNLNITNQPFDQATDGTNIYWLIQWGGGYYKFQIGIAIKTNPIIRIRINTGENWGAWKEFTLS